MINKTDSQNKIEDVALGIDYGESNIGLAFGRGTLVMPLQVISGKNINEALRKISDVVLQNRIKTLVLGLPLTAEGKETEKSLKVRQFAKLLRTKLKMPTQFISEFNSTNESFDFAVDFGLSQKGRRTTDHFAAAIILKNYFRSKS